MHSRPQLCIPCYGYLALTPRSPVAVSKTQGLNVNLNSRALIRRTPAKGTPIYRNSPVDLSMLEVLEGPVHHANGSAKVVEGRAQLFNAPGMAVALNWGVHFVGVPITLIFGKSRVSSTELSRAGQGQACLTCPEDVKKAADCVNTNHLLRNLMWKSAQRPVARKCRIVVSWSGPGCEMKQQNMLLYTIYNIL